MIKEERMKAKRFKKGVTWSFGRKVVCTKGDILIIFILGMIPIFNIFILIFTLFEYEVYFEEIKK